MELPLTNETYENTLEVYTTKNKAPIKHTLDQKPTKYIYPITTNACWQHAHEACNEPDSPQDAAVDDGHTLPKAPT